MSNVMVLPDPATADLAPRLRRAVMHLARRLRQEGPTPEGLTFSQLSALATVDREGTTTLGALAAAERVQPPTMTKIVAHLESAGFLVREVDAADRRVSWVRVTASGRRLVHRRQTDKDRYLAARIAALSPAERAILEQALPLLDTLTGPVCVSPAQPSLVPVPRAEASSGGGTR